MRTRQTIRKIFTIHLIHRFFITNYFHYYLSKEKFLEYLDDNIEKTQQGNKTPMGFI